jgi:hypothetical protein
MQGFRSSTLLACTLVAFAAALLGPCATAFAAPPAPKVQPATDGIFEAFKSRPLVALGEWHGLAQEFDFYLALVRDPRFAKEIGNIMLETGSASQQAVVDRYVNGENVPYAELRKVWADPVGWFPAVTYTGSITLYAAIREVNLKLPPEQRIKVWLGEPPIDWSKIKTKADWDPLVKQRDSFPAALAEKEILAKGKKALLIWGTGHFWLNAGERTLRNFIEEKHPGALFVVTPYVGYAQKECAARFERHIKGWPVPSLAGPIRGSTLEADIWRKGCNPITKPDAMPADEFEALTRDGTGLTADALLYLGPRKSLQLGARDPDIIMDLDYRAELARRYLLRGGKEMGPSSIRPSTAQPFFND